MTPWRCEALNATPAIVESTAGKLHATGMLIGAGKVSPFCDTTGK